MSIDIFKPQYIDAVKALVGGEVAGLNAGPMSELKLWDDQTPPTEEAVQTKLVELKAEYDALAWKRSREAEYPTIAELTVALYDTDDKADIEAKRAAVKAKYPKPS